MAYTKSILLVASLFCVLITVDSLPSPLNSGLAGREGTSSDGSTGTESNLLTRLPMVLDEFLKAFSRGEQSPTLKALDTALNRTINFPGRSIYDVIVATFITLLSLFPPFRLLQAIALAFAFYLDFVMRSLGSPASGLLEYMSFLRP